MLRRSSHPAQRLASLIRTLSVAKTKLTNRYSDATLATSSTIRNWRSVLKLVEMTATTR